MLPAGFLQVVLIITIVNPHLTMINFKYAIDETAGDRRNLNDLWKYTP
jgi:hypothetical protein